MGFKTVMVQGSLIGFAVLQAVAWSPNVLADTIQLPIQRAFIPSVGYNDNNNVVFRAEGSLPDACYVLGDHTVVRSQDGKTFFVQQGAWRKDDGACGSGDLLPEGGYSEDVSLGQLAPGDYQIALTSEAGVLSYTGFNVAQAKNTATDEYTYANVTQISVKDVFTNSTDVTVTFSGTFYSSCGQLAKPISVQQLGDVFVIRPIEIKVGNACSEMILRYFQHTLHLGKLTPGEYLVHLRARNGRAVERTFKVIAVQDPASTR